MRPGTVIDADGAVLARHDGVYGFTVGQRKGLGIAGPGPDGTPRYVTAIDAASDTVRVGAVADLDVWSLTGRAPVFTGGSSGGPDRLRGSGPRAWWSGPGRRRGGGRPVGSDAARSVARCCSGPDVGALAVPIRTATKCWAARRFADRRSRRVMRRGSLGSGETPGCRPADGEGWSGKSSPTRPRSRLAQWVAADVGTAPETAVVGAPKSTMASPAASFQSNHACIMACCCRGGLARRLIPWSAGLVQHQKLRHLGTPFIWRTPSETGVLARLPAYRVNQHGGRELSRRIRRSAHSRRRPDSGWRRTALL